MTSEINGIIKLKDKSENIEKLDKPIQDELIHFKQKES